MRRPALDLTSVTLLILATACNDIPVQPSDNPAIVSVRESAAPMARVSRLDLGTLGGTRSYATDVNDPGTVVGWSENAAGVERAFRWTPAQGMTDLGTLPGDDWSRAISITSTGQILGVSGRSGDYVGTPLVWAPSGAATPLAIPLLPGATAMFFTKRNTSGQVTGWSLGTNFFSHAWVWSPSRGIYDITAHIPVGSASSEDSYGSDINASGLAVGTSNTRVCGPHAGECWHAFLWNSVTGYREIGIPAGYDPSLAQVVGSALNDLGVVVGWTSDRGAFPPIDPYLWTDRTGFTVLPTFAPDPDNYGYAESVNLVGTVVGASSSGVAQLGPIQAAAWPRAGGIVKLSPDDPNPSVAVAVNLFGVVVGWSSLDCCGFAGTHAILWKLGPGRGATPQPLTTQSSSAMVDAPRAASDAPSGPIGCLSDRNAVMSRQRLIDCVVRRRH